MKKTKAEKETVGETENQGERGWSRQRQIYIEESVRERHRKRDKQAEP